MTLMTRSKAKLTGPVNPPFDSNSLEALTDISKLAVLDSVRRLDCRTQQTSYSCPTHLVEGSHKELKLSSGVFK